VTLILRTFALLVVAVVALASCGQTRDATPAGPAATIVGFDDAVEIPRSELEEIVVAVEGSDAFMEAVFDGSLPPTFRPVLLTNLIQLEVMERQLVELGGEVAPEERQDIQGRLDEELSQLLTAAGLGEQTEEVMDQIRPYTDVLVERNAHLAALGRTLTADDEPEFQDVACVRHILVEDEAEAEDILAQLEEGADFAELAIERSTDPGSGPNGGDLGCAPSVRYVPEFAEAVDNATPGEVVGPVETQFGFHVIVVDEFRQEEVPVDVLRIAGDALGERMRELTITVAPDLGEWDETSLIVTQP
jgi:hypothetical protein